MTSEDAVALFEWLHPLRHVVVISGAGCSTESGIPDYRDAEGNWKHRQPVSYRDFLNRDLVRKRYWARSRVGWLRFRAAKPNPAHQALAALERAGRLESIVTQNVDGLHQQAGSSRVIDLHGRLDSVECLKCENVLAREAFQSDLDRLNPAFAYTSERTAPDGDAQLVGAAYETFRVPECPRCRGVLKPAVVFFGESVPKNRVSRAMATVDAADGLLVVGSSLMVFSGFRFVRRAFARRIPVAVLNLGRTRADEGADLRIRARCGSVLPAVSELLLC